MPYDREVRSLLEQEIHSETDTKQSAWEIATSPAFAPILAACFFLNLSGNASNAVFSLFAYTPVEKGGLSQEVSLAFETCILSIQELMCKYSACRNWHGNCKQWTSRIRDSNHDTSCTSTTARNRGILPWLDGTVANFIYLLSIRKRNRTPH